VLGRRKWYLPTIWVVLQDAVHVFSVDLVAFGLDQRDGHDIIVHEVQAGSGAGLVSEIQVGAAAVKGLTYGWDPG
jgi:hypothetical protein